MSSGPALPQTPKDAKGRGMAVAVGLTAVLLMLTLPRFLYPGDPKAIRLSAEQLVLAGDVSVPDAIARQFGDRGQYFFQHPETGRWYPKYGIANTAMYAIPLGLEYLLTGELASEMNLSTVELRRRRWTLNAFNLLLSCILSGYLFSLARRETASSWLAIGFVFSVLFCTFAWNYLRAHTVEIFQLLMFTTAWRHAVAVSDALHGRPLRPALVDAVVAVACIGVLVLGKLAYAPLLVIVPGFVVASAWKAARELGQAQVLRRYASAALATLATMVAIILWANWYRFGSPWETGYAQWEPEHILLNRNPLSALIGYCVDERTSLFLYFAPLAIALPGVALLSRERRWELGALGCAVLAMLMVNANFVNWRGEWCYGPRYMLFVLPVASLPAIAVWERGLPALDSTLRAMGRLVVVVVLAWSFQNQLRVNALDFLMPTRVAGLFEAATDDVIHDYFWKRPYWRINSDLIWFAIGRGEFPPIEHLRPGLTDRQLQRISEEVRRSVTLNLSWIEPTATGEPDLL